MKRSLRLTLNEGLDFRGRNVKKRVFDRRDNMGF